MTDGIDAWTNDIHCGDAVETLAAMPESSVHMCMTSPPYYGLRDYGEGIEPVWGGDEDCDHDWAVESRPQQGGANTDDNPPGTGADATTQKTRLRGEGEIDTGRCQKCGAWRGQLGLEPSLNQFIQNMVAVGREIRRVLRPDGNWWLNLGDTFAGSWGAQSKTETVEGRDREDYPSKHPASTTSLKRKCKMLVPHRVAIALADDGWVVRGDPSWVKSNYKPHPVKDRLVERKEFLFHLTPEPMYWWDLDAIREDALHPNGKNPGDVFVGPVSSYSGDHSATFPAWLPEKPIKSSCPPRVCVDCGTPYERLVEESDREVAGGTPSVPFEKAGYKNRTGNHEGRRSGLTLPKRRTVGWERQCECDTDDTEPGIVLDPFAGAGTTCLVAKRLRRRFIGFDIDPDSVAEGQHRVGLTVDEPERLLDDGETHLGAYSDGGESNAE